MPYLAKSDGTLLKTHLESVSNMAEQLATYLQLNDRIIKLCKIAAYLHDIGKACPYFQKFYTNPNKKVKSKLRYHNEIGCIFLLQHKESIKTHYDLTNDDFDIISNSVYWHHPQAIDIKNNFILNSVDDNNDNIYDVLSIKSFLSELNITDLNTEDPELNIPHFFVNTSVKNSLILIVRSIVIKSDWIISSGIPYDVYANTYEKKLLESYVCPSTFNIDRFSTQMSIISRSCNSNTIICNAPAGFGKTYIGLVWALTTNKRVLWVCPRNEIIKSVYQSIISLLDLLHLDITVETFYSSERQESNTNNDTSRITITNIDAVVQPMASRSKSGLQYDMLECTIVFDEYHEFVSDSPIYAAFCILLQARHNEIKAKQMLLSATPIELPLDYLDYSTVLVLPEKNKHFDSQHNNKYLCNITKAGPKVIPDDTFVIYNTIKNAQSHDEALCLHSKYTTEDRNAKFTSLYNSYGKLSKGNKFPVSSAPVMQASLDVSASHLFESVSSPNNTMQRIGRCDRFGTCIDRTITFIENNDKSELKYIEHNYSKELYKLWYTFITNNMCGEFTLNELYEKYNNFNKMYQKNINVYMKEKYNNSFEKLINDCIPKRAFNESYDNRSKKSSKSNGTIRNPEPNMYYIVWNDELNEYVGPFSISISEFKKEYNNFGYHTEKSLKNIAADIKNKFPELYEIIGVDKQKGKNKRNYAITHGFDFARYCDTPYPVKKSNKIYSSEKGIIDLAH